MARPSTSANTDSGDLGDLKADIDKLRADMSSLTKHMKDIGLARSPMRKGEKLREKVDAQLAAIKKLPKLVRSFFLAPSVAYIIDC